MADWIHYARVYDYALSNEEVAKRFAMTERERMFDQLYMIRNRLRIIREERIELQKAAYQLEKKLHG